MGKNLKILIADQQLDIESLKELVEQYQTDLREIHSMLYAIGGPLNDNILNFTKEQRAFLKQIADIAEL